MANISETSTWETGVYQIELTDPVIGGPSGISNLPHRHLANRTVYLKEQIDALAANTVQLGNADPIMDGAASAGTATLASRQDHRHPTDTTRAPTASPTFTGIPTAPTAPAGTNTTQIATTAFVQSANTAMLGSAAPLVNGVATAGTSSLASRQDHVHPVDTSRAPVNSPTFTGTPTAPTAPLGTRNTRLATMETFAQEFAASLGSAGGGWQRLASGLILQYGSATLYPGLPAGSGTIVTFPLAFPGACYLVLLTNVSSNFPPETHSVHTLNKTSFRGVTSVNSGGTMVFYLAIGV